MTEEGMEFQDALAMATELGYAEADPTADIEGLDAGRKMAIMASIAFNSRVVFSDVNIEGISRITARDIACAKDFGMVIKLLGVAKNTENGVEVSVHPMLLEKNHPLATVRDAFNAVFVHGDAVDDAMFYGRGAGEFPTASAVMGDIIEECRAIVNGCNGRIHCTCYKNIPVKEASEIENKYFLRLKVCDRPGVLASIASVLGNNQVSIFQVVQSPAKNGEAELVIVTDKVKDHHFRDALLVFEGMSVIRDVCSVIRVY
jgi:homoserine dehydrogenase